MNIANYCLLRVLLRTRNKICGHKYTKNEILTKVTQRYVFSKIKTFETSSVMPHSQNYIVTGHFRQFLEILNLAETSK